MSVRPSCRLCAAALLVLGVALASATSTGIGSGNMGNSEMVHYPPCVFNPLCSCSKSVPDLGLVFCVDVPLPRIPPPINSSKVFLLHLENNGLRAIEPYFLQGTGLYRLEISRNPLPGVPDEAFLGLERSLWELELQYNDLTEIPSRAMRHLQKLKLLDLRGNQIWEVLPESWRGLENSLQTLILADNSLSSLPQDAFSSLPLLETLDLSGNNLQEIESDVFRAGPPRLVRLNLADNLLSSVPYRQLNSLRLLRHLDLAYNRIMRLHSASHSEPESPGSVMSLDTLRLDYNHIQHLPPGAFQHFDILNKTYLDGNPLVVIQADAFRDARIRELSIRGCGLTELSQGAFGGLEASLTSLDLSANNLTDLPHHLLHEFDFLRTLNVRDNRIPSIAPGDTLNGFQYSLYRLDISGRQMGITSLPDLRRMRNLRSLSLSRMPQTHIQSEDFLEFGVDLEELRLFNGGLKVIKNHAFRHVRGLKILDLSENEITQLESDAFSEIGHSLLHLKIAHGMSGSVSNIPSDALRPLVNLQHLDMSNNRIRSMPETSFHFLKRLKVLELQDNQIDNVPKGTFQGGIHANLEEIHLSFNGIDSIITHTFVDLPSLERLMLDDNRISRVERRAFMNMGRLKRLDLRGNKLRQVSDEAFQALPELELLDLAYNELEDLDFAMLDQVGTLSSFRLNVSHNRLQVLEPNVSALTGRGMYLGGGDDLMLGNFHSNVKVLDLSHNNISRIGRGYLRPVERSLTHLHLSHNWLRNVTRDVFGNMPHLQWLDLSANQLAEIDFDAFRNTRRLQVLLLERNWLTDIPSELFRAVSGLRVVDLAHNRLRSLPDSLFTEEGMERLDVSHNLLGRPPTTSLTPAAASTLCELDVSWNHIAALTPEFFSRFKSLQMLDLSYNRLVRVDDATFASLGRLSHLDLSHNPELVLESRGRSFQGLEDTLLELNMHNNSLSTVPELPLPQLRTLRLSHNHIQDVPPDTASNLTSLRHFDVAYNRLQNVPPAARQMHYLRYLELDANPIKTLSTASFQGTMERLQSLDIRYLPLNYFEPSALSKLTSLKTLYLSTYHGVKDFNIPQVVQQSPALRNLYVQVDEDGDMEDETAGPLPSKVRNITFSGRGLRYVPNNLFRPFFHMMSFDVSSNYDDCRSHVFNTLPRLNSNEISLSLKGMRSPRIHFTLRNTSVESMPRSLFEQMEWVRNISLDLRNNTLRSLANPNTGEYPGAPETAFLTELYLQGNSWSCDCQLGWVEVWQRKRRQYMCPVEWRRRGEMLPPECRHDFDHYDAEEEDDDLRVAECANRNNQSLLEVFKEDIECGWGSGAPATSFISTWILGISVIIATFLPSSGNQ